MYSHWREQAPDNTSFRELYDNAKHCWPALERSINDELITLEQFMNDEYLAESGMLYNDDEYCRTIEGSVMLKDDAYWCDRLDEFSDETFVVRIGDRIHHFSQSGIDDYSMRRETLREYNGEFWDGDALSMNDLVVMYDGEIERIRNVYLHSDGDYYYEPEEEYDDEEEEDDDEEEYIRGYHSRRTQEKITFTKAPQFFIGIEVEKEDRDVLTSISISNFESKCEGYKKERDGSLDTNTGFEMITPPYELAPREIMKHIKSNDVLVKHFNAGVSLRCGGHVNLSEEGLTGEELFSKLKGYNPLLYALYYKRISKTYCKGKSNSELKYENEKYQAVKIHSNRIEYRLVSAVRDLDTLEWRLRLFELIAKNPTACPKVAFYFINTKLKRHLKKMYKGDRFDTLIKRVISMTEKFENIEI